MSRKRRNQIFLYFNCFSIHRKFSAVCSLKLDGSLNEAITLKIQPKFDNQNKLKTDSVISLDLKSDPATKIFAGIGETFRNLTQLLIVKQSTKFIFRCDFENLEKLEVLNLNGNQIEFVPENAFWNLTNLKVLNLQGNKIKSFAAQTFENLIKLSQVNFADNQIEYLPKALLALNIEISSVKAHRNPLKWIEIDFTTLQNLRNLSLLGENCCGVQTYDKTIQEKQEIVNRNCRLSKPIDYKPYQINKILPLIVIAILAAVVIGLMLYISCGGR